MNALLLVALAVLPSIGVVDDGGRMRSTDSWRGAPMLLVPIYTRCPLACPTLVRNLERAVAESTAPADSYRVVLFSFDPRDTPADLRAFREREHVPLAWTLATAAESRRLMEAVDFQWMEDRGSIAHSSVVIALTPDLATAKVLSGTNFSSGDIERALSIARGGRDWIGSYGPAAFAALVLIAIGSAVYLVMYAMRSTPQRRSRSELRA